MARQRLSDLAQRLTDLRSRISPPEKSGRGEKRAERPTPFAGLDPAGRTIEDLELKFEALDGDGSDWEKAPKS